MKRHFSFSYLSVSYCIRILLGCIIVWQSLFYLHDDKKIWALISVIVVSDPDFGVVKTTTLSRVINTLTGCLLGTIFMYVKEPNFWTLMLAIAASVIVSTSFKNYPSSWKLAPVTVVIVMTPMIIEDAEKKDTILLAVMRTGEILYGSFIAFLLGYIFSKLKINERIQDRLLH